MLGCVKKKQVSIFDTPHLLLYYNKIIFTNKQICLYIRIFILTKDILSMPIWTNNQYSSWISRLLRLRLLRRAKSEKSHERKDEHGFSY